MSSSVRHSLSLFLALSLSAATITGCKATPSSLRAQQSKAPDNAVAISARLHEIAAAGRLADLHWSNFSRYRLYFENFYEMSNFAPAWLNRGQPTPQALAVIRALEDSRKKGLDPNDYDAPLWQSRLQSLEHSPDADAEARFDAALTVSAMRYISDLHVGRVNPKHFRFGIDIKHKKYDLPQFLMGSVTHASNVQDVLDGVEPPYHGYRRIEIALQRYLLLAEKPDGPQVPAVQKAIASGSAYSGIAQLTQRLQLLGDLPQIAVANRGSLRYEGALVDAVKRFQARHGLAPDGVLNQSTIRQLNVPLSTRVHQLNDALERWRWLPPSFPLPPVVVNIPEFALRTFSADREVVLSMNVIVGKTVRHQTPVFARDMRYIVFRPYWNVPRSIVRGEILPAIAKNRHYIADKHYEVTDLNGNVVANGPVSDAILEQLRAGKLAVRQKPGPHNSLGLVKFIFPNEHDVYLHDTPVRQLFSQSRRDFSHGCIRVQKPAELAAYLLRDQPPWNLEKVRAAMLSGPDNRQVNLAVPVPVLILYVTAVAEEDGTVHFFDDIYGHDKALEALLAKGRPYPE